MRRSFTRNYTSTRSRNKSKNYALQKTARSSRTSASRSISYRPRNGFNQVYTQKCKSNIKYIIGSTNAGADLAYAYAFKLSDIADYSQWTSVYDLYRITNITAQIIGANQNSSVSSANQCTQIMASAIDYDDNNVTTSLETTLNFGSSYVHGPTCNDRRSFTPKINNVAWQGGVGTGLQPASRQWLDALSSNVEHYGLKVYIPKSQSANVFSWTIIFEYTIEYKNNR